jgi:transcriptional regulator with XRE-family HTH domain
LRQSARAIENQKTMQPDTATIGGFLRTLRSAPRLTMGQAAHKAGIHRATLHRWEKGLAQPRLSELSALLSALDASAQQKRDALHLMDAPRAARLIRQEVTQIAEQTGMAALPHGGDLLRAMRMRRGLSLDEAATRVQVTGGTLRRWEKREVWPSPEQLHRLGYALGAQAEEVIALSAGRFAQVQGEEENVPLESLQQRFEDVYASRYALMQSQLMELSLLALEAQVWRFAVRSAVGRRLLAQVYTEHAHVLSEQERFTEMGQYADRALDIAPEKSTRETFWVTAGVYSITAASHAAKSRASASGNRRSIERFRRLLPFARTPGMEGWILSWLGSLLVEDGATESGLFTFDQACQVASRSENPIERRLRENDKAQVLLRLQQPAEALEIITIEPDDNAYFRTGQLLEQAQAYLQLGHVSEAHDKLHQAYNHIEAHSLLHFRSHADELAQRL